jgi:hypothetical protein
MRRAVILLAVVVLTMCAAAAASAAGGVAKTAAFVGPIAVSGSKATLKVRYTCNSGQTLWISAKETARGYSATRLMKEGSSKSSAAWWDSHRNRIKCNGKPHTTTFTLDKVEKGTKGSLVDGSAWVQFCITKGKTEATTVLTLSRSGWVRVNA